MSDQEPSWNEIKPIWERWTDLETPDAVLLECELATKSTSDYIMELNRMNIEAGNLATDVGVSERRGQKFGKALAMSMRGCYMLGLEYGSRNKVSPRTDEFVARQAKLALPMIRAALEPVSLTGAQLIGHLAKSDHLSEQEAHDLARDFGKVALRSGSLCFKTGLEYSVGL